MRVDFGHPFRQMRDQRCFRGLLRSGPMQPGMAIIAALRDGVSDARLGRTPYLLAIVRGEERSTRPADPHHCYSPPRSRSAYGFG